ncbi:hypothetical protein PIB30_023930 [Stylosanthes scabra]|uniref:Uncharacterized protein n=1 Tax=Stylosanthes scabra TaxID=79078 RepID=A0ABU6VBV4_9FABA|nr:hypothetical protein [Stylosanthes scabra]
MMHQLFSFLLVKKKLERERRERFCRLSTVHHECRLFQPLQRWELPSCESQSHPYTGSLARLHHCASGALRFSTTVTLLELYGGKESLEKTVSVALLCKSSLCLPSLMTRALYYHYSRF